MSMNYLGDPLRTQWPHTRFDEIVVEPAPAILGVDLSAKGIELVAFREDKTEWFRVLLSNDQIEAISAHTVVSTA